MVGLGFGHHLGLPRALSLSGLPLSPLVPRYRELVAEQHTSGLRHIGEALVARGGHLRVLDGLYVPRAPRGWRRADGAELRRAAAHGTGTAGLLRKLAELNSRDPAALRRVLLYQLIELLQDHPRGGEPATAVSLGVDADEAAALVHAARMRGRLSPRQRAAAEGLQDEWEGGRLRSAVRLAAQLPSEAGQDPFLDRRLKEITAAESEADAALDEAHRLEDEGDTAAAGVRYLRAARLAADCRHALSGLVRTHRPTAGAPGALRAGLGRDSVQLSWAGEDASSDGRHWRVIRLTRVVGGPPSVDEVQGRAKGAGARDGAPPLGGRVRYAAIPLRGSLIDGPPLVSEPLLVAPEATDLRITDGRERIDATWTRPPGATGVTVVLTGPDGGRNEAAGQEGGFTARGLRTGEYRVRVRCLYRDADGREVASPGVEASAGVRPWPEPVRTLGAAPLDGGVRFTWTGGENAEVRLVEWPGDAPVPGTELASPVADLPAPLAWRRAAGALVPPSGALVRVTAVAVLGECAVAGPSVRVEAPRPVTGLTAERSAGGLTRVTFDWPADVGLVTVVTEQNGHRAEHRVVRSVYLREGLYVPAGPSALRLTASAAPRAADATVVPPVATGIALPADIAITYRIVPGARRPLRRRPVTVRVTLSSPDGGPAADLPEFVLVARPGDRASAPLRPRHCSDGTTVLRLSGAELHRSGTVEREIAPGACRPPYALRGFLLGGDSASSVRLEEPSPATLVMC